MVDLERVRRIIAAFAEALGLPDRMQELDELVDRVLITPSKPPLDPVARMDRDERA